MLQGVLAGCHGGGASGLACALRTQRFPCGIGVVVSRTGTFWRFQEPRVNYGLLCERPTQTIKPCVRSRKLDCFWRLNRFPGLASKWFVVLAVAATNSETVPKAARTCSPGEGLCMLRCRSACVALCDCSRHCGRFPWAVLTPALLETWGSVGTSMDRGGGGWRLPLPARCSSAASGNPEEAEREQRARLSAPSTAQRTSEVPDCCFTRLIR